MKRKRQQVNFRLRDILRNGNGITCPRCGRVHVDIPVLKGDSDTLPIEDYIFCCDRCGDFFWANRSGQTWLLSEAEKYRAGMAVLNNLRLMNGQQPYGDRAAALQSMRYAEYLATPEWQEKRKDALRRARYRCAVCNGTLRLEVHHRVYGYRGQEQPDDLTVLCHDCHELFSKNGTLKPLA